VTVFSLNVVFEMEVHNDIFSSHNIEFNIFEKKNAIEDMSRDPYDERTFHIKKLLTNKVLVAYLNKILPNNIPTFYRLLDSAYYDFETDDEGGSDYIMKTLHDYVFSPQQSSYESVIRIHIFAGKVLYDKLKELHCQ